MTVYYLSITAFSDNQVNLLHHFPKEYEIIYGVVIPVKNSNYTEKELTEYCQLQNIKFIPFRLKYRFRDPRVLITYYKIVSTIKKMNPDVIFVTNFDQIYFNMLMLLLDKRKTIIAMHDVVNHSKTAFDKLTNLGKKILLKNFKHFLTYSKLQGNILKESHKKKEVYTIPLSLVDLGNLPSVTKKKDFVTFLFFGNILHYKGLDILLHSVKRLAKNNNNFRLIIAGRSQDWEETYKPLISDNELVHSHIGFVENNEIPFYFSKADYLVLPYRDTTQSGPLMIAYNYNVPVLASNAEGFHEFFENGTTGFMFDLNEPNDIDRVLLEAMERTESEYSALKKKLSTHTLENFSIGRQVNAYENMFDYVHEFND